MDVLSGLTLAAPAGLNAYIPLLAVAAVIAAIVLIRRRRHRAGGAPSTP